MNENPTISNESGQERSSIESAPEYKQGFEIIPTDRIQLENLFHSLGTSRVSFYNILKNIYKYGYHNDSHKFKITERTGIALANNFGISDALINKAMKKSYAIGQRRRVDDYGTKLQRDPEKRNPYADQDKYLMPNRQKESIASGNESGQETMAKKHGGMIHCCCKKGMMPNRFKKFI